MLSYWEQQSFLQYDHIVIGSGIVGLSTAIELKQKYPQQSVLVLERGLLPTGASTRNAGFATTGSLAEILDDLTHMRTDEVQQLVAFRKRGLSLLRHRLSDAVIGYAERGSYELLRQDELQVLERMDEVNALLKPINGADTFSLNNDQIAASGFNGNYVAAMVQNRYEGELHTGKMMRALVDVCLNKGIEIKTGCQVMHFNETSQEVQVFCNAPGLDVMIGFKAAKLFVCTNAFTRSLLPDLDLKPGRGQVLITHPVPGLRFKGIYHFDEGYFYFREIDGRVLFGGGRNLDFEGETTTEFGLSDRIQYELEEKLRTVILPDTPYRIDMRWSGIMAFGPTKQPLVQQLTERIAIGVRMGGMGVAIGSAVGMKLAELSE